MCALTARDTGTGLSVEECLQRIESVYPVTILLANGSVITERMHFEDCVYDVIKKVVIDYYPERSWPTFELYNSIGEHVYKREHVKYNTDDILQLVDTPRKGSKECPSLEYGGSRVRLTFCCDGFRVTATLNNQYRVNYNQRLLSVIHDEVPTNQIWIFDKRILKDQEPMWSLRDGDIIHVLSPDR